MIAPTEVHRMPLPDSIVQWLYWFHNLYPFVGLLALMMLIDFITGVFASRIRGRGLSSAISFVGMSRKVIMILAVGMGVILEPYANGLPLGRMIALCYTVTESLSIIENMDRAGVPVPAWLRTLVQNMRKKDEDKQLAAPSPSVTITHAESVDIHQDPVPQKTGPSDSSVRITTQTTQVFTTDQNSVLDP